MESIPLDSFIQPFESFDELLLALFILVQYKHLHIDSICFLLENLTNKEYVRSDIASFARQFNLLSKQYGFNFFSSINELPEKIDALLNLNGIIKFVSPAEICQFCTCQSLKISNEDNSEKAIVYYASQKPMKALLISKQCRRCGAYHYLSYSEQNQTRKPLPAFFENKYLAFSRETIFETKLFDMLTSDLLFKHSTFQGFCSAFNYMSSLASYALQNIPDRMSLVEHRLIECWFLYKAQKFSNEYFFGLDGLPMPYLSNLDHYLRCLKPYLLPYFTKKWTGIFHKSICKHKKCSLTISIDGNFKCNRLKCMYENVSMTVPEIGKICLFYRLLPFYFY